MQFVAFIPLVLIFTATRDESLCVIANPAFVVYSSIVSFYVPFIITLLVYVQIYVVLRKRRKRVNTKPKQRVCQAAEADAATSFKVSCWSRMLLYRNSLCSINILHRCLIRS